MSETAEENSPAEVDMAAPPLPTAARKRVERLLGRRDERRQQSEQAQARLVELTSYLGIAGKVSDALEALSQKLFKELLGTVESKISIALQEILEQPIKLRADTEFLRGTASVDFWIEREGNREHAFKGQGGSVVNILSVGLRLFALTALDPTRHRGFLVLDEQDCWLRPELVPRLVKIVKEAGRALGIQVIMISHHDPELFEHFADNIYRFTPVKGGTVEVAEHRKPAADADQDEDRSTGAPPGDAPAAAAAKVE